MMAARRVVFHPEAKRELTELYDYIAEQAGQAIAWNYVSGIREFCLEFAVFPERGTERTDLGPGLRLIGYRRRTSIAFVVGSEEIAILGIFYGGRQVTSAILAGRK